MNSLSGTPQRRPVLIVLFLLAVAAPLAVTAPAHALSTRVTDRRDRPPRADVVDATYSDGEAVAGITVHVRRLRATWTLTTRIARHDDRSGYEAVVSDSGGHLTRTLVRDSKGNRTRVPCDLTASSSTTSDTVRVSVPQSCLHFRHFQDRHLFRSTFAVGRHHDYAATRVVGRGSSPGCATSTEMHHVTDGQRLASVHAHLDTAGRFGDGGAGGFSRVYDACQGGHPYWVAYDGRSRRVTDKGRV